MEHTLGGEKALEKKVGKVCAAAHEDYEHTHGDKDEADEK